MHRRLSVPAELLITLRAASPTAAASATARTRSGLRCRGRARHRDAAHASTDIASMVKQARQPFENPGRPGSRPIASTVSAFGFHVPVVVGPPHHRWPSVNPRLTRPTEGTVALGASPGESERRLGTGAARAAPSESGTVDPYSILPRLDVSSTRMNLQPRASR